MPTLTRSQRSKPSKRRGEDEEEMPPPPAVVELPRTRSTRSKKVSKQAEKEELVEVPKSPTSSTRSTRSRAKPKAKVAVPVEEEEIVSPPPSSTRSTRSTKQKGTGVGKSSKALSAAGKKEQKNEERSEDPVLDPFVRISPMAEAKEKRTIRTAAKKGTATAKKKENKRPPPPEVLSTDEFSEEEIERAQVGKKLTLEQLHKQHVVPLKSALDVAVCDMFPKFMAKLNDPVRKAKSDKEFKKLMSLTELAQMPPPVGPAPKAKGKARKRARSPENLPATATTTTVPDSFAFAENSEELVPAKKKMVMDQPTPVKQDLTESSETETEDAAVASAAQSSDEETLAKAKESSKPTETHVHETETDSSTEQRKNIEEAAKLVMSKKGSKSKKPKDGKTKKQEKEKVKEEEAGSGSENKEKPQIPKKGDKKKREKKDKKNENKLQDEKSSSDASTPPETPKISKDEKVNDTGSKKEDSAPSTVTDTKSIMESKKDDKVQEQQPPSTKPDDVNDEEMDIFEQSTVDMGEESGADAVEKQAGDKKSAVDKSAPEPENKNLVLDATYTFDTPKDKEPMLNSTFTPELFTDTPKSRVADQTMVIAKHEDATKTKQNQVLAPPSPEPEPNQTSVVPTNSASGKVSSLVSFFDKSKKEAVTGKGNASRGSKPEVVDLDKTRSISPKHQDSLDKPTTTSCADLNSTYVLPAAKKVNASSSAMNVTVCVKKSSNPDAEVKPKSDIMLKPIVPPSFCQQNQTSRFDLSASRTFCKEPPSLAMVVEEEDEQQRKESLKAAKEKEKSEKMRLMPNTKPSSKEKDKTKGSTSSSSSNSSMKSASSQPCLITKKLPTSATKNGPNYGSAPRLHEIVKPKQFDLEEAERRRQEILQLKAEKNKKKLDEWKKKTEQHKLEEEKRLKEKQKIIQSASASSILKKAVPLGVGKPAAEPSVGFVKPKYVLGPSTTKMGGAPTMPPPLSKNLYKPPPPAPIEVDLDDSFKSAHNASSLLDQTTEGHLSSYDITMYEDLDEDLKHRENKSLPSWATDKESLKAALFSMVLLPEYKDKLPDGFPKADKSYKLFPNVMGKR